MKQIEERLDSIILKTIDNKRIMGAVLHVQSGDRKLAWSGAAGNINLESRFFIASITKLYVTAVLLKLREKNIIQLTDKIVNYLGKSKLTGIHRHHDTEYSYDITIEQLMAHTSGLPDYFQHKRKGGGSLEHLLTSGYDHAWSFDSMVEDVKQMKPHFLPGTKNKALYSDTNYQLLGKIIETVTNLPLNEVFRQYVFEPLSLTNTYLYSDIQDQTPVPLYYKNKALQIPQAMTSFGPDGGIVSTAEELMRFLRAFFEGELFPKTYLIELYQWNKIFFPLQYGIGIAKFKLPRIFSPFRLQPELIGHSGISGAFAFYSPTKDIYLCGTINQISPPNLPYQLMLRVLHTV